MRSSSDSIAQLVSALAKAQIELVNPAKTLTAVIHSREAGPEGRSYRYAPLSAGLEIVRKTSASTSFRSFRPPRLIVKPRSCC